MKIEKDLMHREMIRKAKEARTQMHQKMKQEEIDAILKKLNYNKKSKGKKKLKKGLSVPKEKTK